MAVLTQNLKQYNVQSKSQTSCNHYMLKLPQKAIFNSSSAKVLSNILVSLNVVTKKSVQETSAAKVAILDMCIP